MPHRLKAKVGTITKASDSAQMVSCDDGSTEWMMGMNRITGAKEGDRVRLTYRATGTYGLWFGRVIETAEK